MHSLTGTARLLLHVYYALTKTVLTELCSAADTEKLLGEPQIALCSLSSTCARSCAHMWSSELQRGALCPATSHSFSFLTLSVSPGGTNTPRPPRENTYITMHASASCTAGTWEETLWCRVRVRTRFSQPLKLSADWSVSSNPQAAGGVHDVEACCCASALALSRSLAPSLSWAGCRRRWKLIGGSE